MKMSEYLEEYGESQSSFAKRAGLPYTTVNEIILNDNGTHAATASKIIKATGGLVSLEDLVGAKRRTAQTAS